VKTAKAINVIKRINFSLFVCGLFSLLFNVLAAEASWQMPVMSDYSKVPPFISREIPPNVIIAMDISGSMKDVAYRDVAAGNWKTGMHDDFNPAVAYYGYFKSNAKYAYDAVNEFFYEDNTLGQWDGNFMNWLCMRRIDVARKVMVGGKVSVKVDAGIFNRNRVSDWSGWDGWYILEGQHEPYDYEFHKQYVTSATSGFTPAIIPDNTVFLISEQKILPQLTTGGNVVQLGDEVEIGQVTMSWEVGQAWQWVPFANAYEQPRVVAKSLTYNGSDPTADPRIQLDTPWPHTHATGFWVRLQEWDYRDGDHTTESFTYIVVESAQSSTQPKGWIDVTMDDGSVWKIQAQKSEVSIGSSACGGLSTPETVIYDGAAPEKPIVFTGVGSWDSSGDTAALVTRNFFASGSETTRVNVLIQEQEASGGGGTCIHSPDEKIHVILLIPPSGASTTISSDTFTYNGTSVTIQAGIKENVDDSWDTITYDSSNLFSEAPMFIADLQTLNGEDPVSIRVGGSSQTNDATAIQLKLGEEKSADNETGHVGENVGWLAVEFQTGYRIRVGVQTEPSGIIQSIANAMRIGLAVYNYDHTKNPTSIYTNNTVNGGTLNPCYPDVTQPADQRSNYDICLSTGVHDPVENIIQAIEEHPLIWGTTPIAETLYEIMKYVNQSDGTYTGNGQGFYDDKSTAATFAEGAAVDPYYYADAALKLECAETFVLHFNDGEPYKDWEATSTHPAEIGDADNDANSGFVEQLDDMALYLRKEDMRPDLSGHQEVVSYYVYAALGEGEQFDSSSRKLRESAVNGGFVDYDNDHVPDPVHGNINNYITSNSGNCAGMKNEWDADEDCNPDTFYFANDGYALVDELMAAFQSILQRTSSGTAASVISNSRSGEGAIYQSIFYPAFNDTLANRVQWVGQVHAMLVDGHGNIREDTNHNGRLDLQDDKFIVFNGETVYKYYDGVKDVGGNVVIPANGVLDASEMVTPSDSGPISSIQFLWSSSDWLNTLSDPTTQRSYDSDANERHIFTFIDDGDKVAETGEIKDFTIANKADIAPYLHLYTPFLHNALIPPPGIDSGDFNDFLDHQADRVINFIRGQDQNTYSFSNSTIPAMRSRQVDHNGDLSVSTWRLGDVVNSTPTLVSKPAENYDLLYSDSTYATFYRKYQKRRNVIYVGANDGMFHAFNGGFFDLASKAFLSQPYEADGVTPDSNYTAHELGAELWAYIPYNLLPHLYWLTEPEYLHVYYVDMKPKIFDAKIFFQADGTTELDSDHPGGWGTVLVGGMRFGGGQIAADLDKTDGPYNAGTDKVMRSAYFILDITNPEDPPRLLGEITLPDMGFSTCYPAVVPVRDQQADGIFNANDWYLVFGSGPTGITSDGPDKNAMITATSQKKAKMFVVDLKELATSGNLAVLTETSGKKDLADTTYTGEYYFSEFSGDDNGFISDPISVDWNLDFTTDTVYFGTVNFDGTDWGGKLRRIVIDNDADYTNWIHDSTLIDLTDAAIVLSEGQPIVAAPTVGLDKDGSKWVYFGTGRFFVNDDAYNDDQQSFYGLKENTDSYPLITRSSLYDSSNVKVYEGGAVVGGGVGVTDYALLSSEVQSYNGWFLDFSEFKERNLGQATLLGDVLSFTTYVPSRNPCTFEGETFLYALNFLTGTSFHKAVIGADSSDTKDGAELVLKKISLGTGLSITPNIHTGRETGSKVFIQTSVGAIAVIDELNPGTTKSGKLFWQEN